MGTGSSKQILASGEGELLKLGPPASGEVVITVDPKRTGSSFTAGTETILPGAAIPLHRHRDQDELLFVYKGQGRATLEGKSVTVVPGAMLYVPKRAWHGLRNTGTGLLQITWASAPPGIEAFFRELSQLNGPADSATMQAIAQRHGVEFHPGGAPAAAGAAGPSPGRRRRRRHRGGRGQGLRAQGQQPPPSQGQAALGMGTQTPASPAAAPLSSGQPQVGRRRRRRRRRRAALPASPASVGSQPNRVTAPPPRSPSPLSTPRVPGSSARGPQRARGPHRRGRVKEVYMDGRWVQVTGEGPVIAPGREPSAPRRKAHREDENTATGPFSVPL